ncbi:unnamed protein product, partial [marine sediment metagenome]
DLSLSRNKIITDISLKYLTNLTTLDLRYNRTITSKYVSKMTKLTMLTCSNASIIDSLTHLQKLHIKTSYI